MWHGKPEWVMRVYCSGLGCEICAADLSLPISPLRRLYWRVQGAILTALFGWWRWVND